MKLELTARFISSTFSGTILYAGYRLVGITLAWWWCVAWMFLASFIVDLWKGRLQIDDFIPAWALQLGTPRAWAEDLGAGVLVFVLLWLFMHH
jgi:hypothetical protein